MARKLGTIFLLSLGLALLLILQPWKRFQVEPPRFFDRLPEADIIGKSSILDLSRTLSSTMYYYKIPGREFLTYDFILSQGKSFGLDIQKPVFFFMDQENWEIQDIGFLSMVSDSSKIKFGIEKLSQLTSIHDTTVLNQRVFHERNSQFFLAYGEDWLFLYQGNNFDKRFNSILNAKKNEIPPKWRDFLNSVEYASSSAAALISFDELKDIGISSASFSISNDSTSVTLNTVITQVDTVRFSLRDFGPSYLEKDFTKSLVNVHLKTDSSSFNENQPLILLASKFSKRIGFPTQSLFEAWTGNLSFRQGGIQAIDEQYVESELDEDFNVTEVIKTKKVNVTGFSLYMSTNKNGRKFVNKLSSKGILTKEGNKYRLLYSPPLNMKLTDTSLALYTSKYLPKMVSDSMNQIIWTNKSTPYTIKIDSTSIKSIYGSVTIPLHKLIEENVPKVQ